MAENVTSTDIVKLIFSSSLTMMSVTVVILAHLLAQYEKAKPLGEKARRPFYISAIIMVIVLILGGIETTTSLAYLLNLYPLDMSARWYSLTICLFALLIGGIVFGALFLTTKMLGKKA